jgi:hypothetical protein
MFKTEFTSLFLLARARGEHMPIDGVFVISGRQWPGLTRPLTN